jgi:hypothetical protein
MCLSDEQIPRQRKLPCVKKPRPAGRILQGKKTVFEPGKSV